MDFHGLISSLSAELRVADLVPDERGQATIVFDDRFDIRLFPDADGARVRLFHNFGLVEPTPELLERALAANVDGVGTGGAFFALYPSDNLALTHVLPLRELSFPEFLEDLAVFVHHVEAWEAYLGGGEPAARPAPLPDALAAFVNRA